MEYRFKNRDGEWRWLYSQGAEFRRDQEGKVVEIIGSFLDVTRRKKDELQLHQAAAVFSSTAEGITITDLQGTILDVNPSFSEITGYTRHEAIGQNPRILKSGRHGDEYYQSMWRSLSEEGFWQGEIWNRSKQGKIFPVLLTISAIKDSNKNTTGYVAAFTDISAIKHSQERLDYLAHHDALTEIPNRLLLNERLAQAIGRADRQQTSLAVVFVDLDLFKNINDSLGHQYGDELLKQVSHRISEVIRVEDTLARISGDEFVVVLEGIAAIDDVAMIADKIMEAFSLPFMPLDAEIRMTCSLGVSLFPEDGVTASELLRNADAAMSRAKEEGRNTYQFYSEEMTAVAFEHVIVENALRNALVNQELYLVYQPQIRLADRKLVSLEALLRWSHADLGLIPPSRFIPIAEQSGQIRSMGEWILRQACEQGKKWLDLGYEFGRIAVNVSGLQVQQEDFLGQFNRILLESGLPASRIEIEVTETFMMKSAEQAINALRTLMDLGVHISIDDFGTGYSSLAYLKKLPVTNLKIDQSFVRDIPNDQDDVEIAKAIVGMARAMGIKVVAEGIETDEQFEFLKGIECDFGQGYLMSKPLMTDDISALLANPRTLESG
jgi:diguanylate cyclase (GGDEF)-like protein/PAS domain S-box-containing protein